MSDDICSWCGLIMADDQEITDIAGLYQHTTCVKKKSNLIKAGKCITCEQKAKLVYGRCESCFAKFLESGTEN